MRADSRAGSQCRPSLAAAPAAMLLLSLLACVLVAGQPAQSRRTPERPNESHFRQFVDQNWEAGRPVLNSQEAVNVTIELSDVVLRYQQTCLVTAWVRLMWHDYRLDWSDRAPMNATLDFPVRATSRQWRPSVQVVGVIEKLRLLAVLPEALVYRSGNVMTAVPVEFSVPAQFSVPGGSERRCVFTLTPMLTSMNFVNLRTQSSTFGIIYSDVDIKEASIQRKEILRDCCVFPFAALEYTIVF